MIVSEKPRRARVVRNELFDGGLELSPPVWVLADFCDANGLPLWVVVEGRPNALPYVVDRVQFE